MIPLKILRKLYSKALVSKIKLKPECEQDPDIASRVIYDALISENPCMIARFGSTELSCLSNYLGVKNNKGKFIDYIKGNSQAWWWDNNILNQMKQWSGFFPANEDKIEQFCELMLEDIPEVDILGSWLVDEQLFEKELEHSQKIHLRLLEPYWAENHWSTALEGKKVLVVHPFAKDIELQYKKRKLLFEKNILPKFQLTTIRAVQSLADEKTEFNDWFEALDYMKSEIDKVDYDICLIGCGAYGFPLAAHVKRMGKKGFHYGGALQLLFGIRGNRWEDPNYGVKEWGISSGFYTNLMNEHWVRPGANDKPKNAIVVEGACYW
ncbi:MAG: hypothetical protein Q8R22_01930 [Flavobacterium sp.]|uniref:hypothetical protein n=1 Tax=Flavobacterium sp. TaxID=239 RepID=UPI00273770B6|nr:hypothetical protein [Flavobacterium sp.]MDP3679576.1 hypothetical protein [Flavobacterium sp.]